MKKQINNNSNRTHTKNWRNLFFLVFFLCFLSDNHSWLLSLHFFSFPPFFASTLSLECFFDIFFFLFSIYLVFASTLYTSSIDSLSHWRYTLLHITRPILTCDDSDSIVVYTTTDLLRFWHYINSTWQQKQQQQRSRFYWCSRQGRETHTENVDDTNTHTHTSTQRQRESERISKSSTLDLTIHWHGSYE